MKWLCYLWIIGCLTSFAYEVKDYGFINALIGPIEEVQSNPNLKGT